MNIRTTCSYQGGPYSWAATDDDTYDGAEDSANRNMVGYGFTREEAIEDLQRLMAEDNEWKEHVASWPKKQLY